MQIPRTATPEELVRAFQQVGPIVTGKLLTDINVGTSETTVQHRLGRVPQGWIEVNPQYGVADVEQSSAADATNLYLRATGAVTGAKLWVW